MGDGWLTSNFKVQKDFFRKGMFGAFVLPFVSLSIILSLFGFFFSLYLLLKSLAITFYTIFILLWQKPPYFTGITFFLSFNNIHLFDILVCYFNFLLQLYSDKNQSSERIFFKRLFKMSFYTLIYLLIYPIVWIVSIYRYSTNDMKW